MKSKIFLFFFLFSFLLIKAQKKCGSFEHLQQQLAANPQMVQQREAIEQFTNNYKQQAGINNLRGTPVYTIPVVVHVLWNTSVENISDAQIQSQLNVLNEDFQLLNTDNSLVPAAFKNFVADCQIQFCLAKRDPNGVPTTGIIRKQTPKTYFSVESEHAKFNNTGGDNAWNASKYLNLWVVPDLIDRPGGILGYAQFPGGPAATDGVVIGYKYFGKTATTRFDKGRTATHEVGHWLNLNHIWGDEPNCVQDDLVHDTPLQAYENYGCPSFPRRDACTPSGSGVMFMNYMDYTDDSCMFMFTNGQKTRMYGVLAAGGARASITSSNGCEPPVALCPVTLTITANVEAPNTDNKQASGTITASNTINSDATAVYHAGNEVALTPGFTAVNGSSFKAYIEGCTGNYQHLLQEPTNEIITYNFRPDAIESENTDTKSEITVNTLLVSPNPFTTKLAIRYNLTAKNSKASIEIYTAMGIKVAGPLQDKQKAGGIHNIEWNTGSLSSGIYLVVLTTDNGKQVKKVVKK